MNGPVYGVSIYILFLSAWVFVCLFVWVSVRFYPINVKTAEPIGPKFFVGPRVTPGKVSGSEFSKICLLQNSICENFKNPGIFFIKFAKFLLVFVLQYVRRDMFTILYGWLFVRFYPINVKTTEPIWPKFCCGTSLHAREGLLMIEFPKSCL